MRICWHSAVHASYASYSSAVPFCLLGICVSPHLQTTLPFCNPPHVRWNIQPTTQFMRNYAKGNVGCVNYNACLWGYEEFQYSKVFWQVFKNPTELQFFLVCRHNLNGENQVPRRHHNWRYSVYQITLRNGIIKYCAVRVIIIYCTHWSFEVFVWNTEIFVQLHSHPVHSSKQSLILF